MQDAQIDRQHREDERDEAAPENDGHESPRAKRFARRQASVNRAYFWLRIRTARDNPSRDWSSLRLMSSGRSARAARNRSTIASASGDACALTNESIQAGMKK